MSLGFKRLGANCGVYGQKVYGLYAECLLFWAVTAMMPKQKCKELSLPQTSPNRT